MAILIALLLVAIIGFVSLGTEVVLALWTQRRMQSAADDAALAAATAVIAGYPIAIATEGYALAAAAGFTAGQGAGCDATPTVYVGPPCDGTHASDRIEVLIREPFTLSLAKVVFTEDFTLHGRAVASLENAWGCAAILDPAGSGALKVSGTADATLTGCSAWVNSTTSGAVQVEGGGILSCDHLYVGGTATGVDATICKTTTRAPVVADPYAKIATPSPTTPCTPIPNTEPATIGPAAGTTVVTLCKGIDLSGAGKTQTLNLCPGVYIIDGALSNSLFKMTNGTTLGSVVASDPNCHNHTGSGVAIVLTSSGVPAKIPTVDVSGGTMTLHGLAAADATTGLPAEMLFFQDRRAAVNKSNGFSGTTNLSGILYFPSEPVVFNGNAATVSTCFEIIAWNLSVGGNPTLSANACASGTPRFGQPALIE